MPKQQPSPSPWAMERFGAAAQELQRAVPEGIHRAHELAMAAHIASTLATDDAYGGTLKVTQHEQLTAAVSGISGVVCRKPSGVRSRFELAVVDALSVVLFPLRYSRDRKHPRQSAKLRRPVSDLRTSLLTLTERTVDLQMTLEQASRDEAEVLAELAEEQAVLEQLAKFGRVVTVGYASNPTAGVFELGWGDLELLDEATGELHWHHWEPLIRNEEGGEAGRPVRRPTPVPDVLPATERFDDAPLDDDLGLVARTPLSAPPISEPEREPGQTGTAQDPDTT